MWGEWPAALPRLSVRLRSLQLWRPGLLAAPAAAHLLPAFNLQPAHRLDAEQAVKRNTVTGGFFQPRPRGACQVCLLAWGPFSAWWFLR